MGLLDRYFGFRWTLLIFHGSSLAYTMSAHNPTDIARYVMGRFKGGADTIAPWSLHMACNRMDGRLWDRMFLVTPLHFLADGTNVSADFIQQVSSMDPGWNARSLHPFFTAEGTKKALPIKKGDYEKPSDRRRYLLEGEDPFEPSFETVCDRVFGTAK